MAEFVRGDVVVVPFPFSDLSQAKRRPALVVAELAGDDLILCQITSQLVRDNYAIPISGSDFSEGGLKQPSHIRPSSRLFTADSNIILYRTGKLKVDVLNRVVERAITILRDGQAEK
jgi:mRNA interferase MazF